MTKKTDKNPKIAFSVLRFLIPEYDREFLYFNFKDLYDQALTGKGPFYAAAWLWMQILSSIPGFFSAKLYWSGIMIKNFLKITIRNFQRHKVYSLINILGLTFGMAMFLLIILWIQDELSYDTYHKNADRIYRLTVSSKIGDTENDLAMSTPLLGQTLVNDFPEVLRSTRFYNVWGDILVTHKDNSFVEKRFMYADSNVFKVLSIPLLKGDPETALKNPNTLVLSESSARKYFGEDNPVGKTLLINKKVQYSVTGVFKDIPRNSHLHADILASFSGHWYSTDQNWVSSNCFTYILLEKNFPPENLETKFPGIIKKHAGPKVKAALGITLEEFYKSGGKYAYELQKITDIHLHSNLQYELEANSDIKYVYFFAAIALFILIIACINFINLTTAKARNRAKEVGIRKIAGSTKMQLIRQFIFESFFLCLIAMFFALVLVYMLLPWFNELSGKQLTVDFAENTPILMIVFCLAIFVGLFSGSYPAFFLASLKPVSMLKHNTKQGIKRPILRRGLVILQFSISIFILIGTFVVIEQLQFIQDRKLGFNKENVLVIKRANALGNQWQAFKREILNNNNILSAAGTNTHPGLTLGDDIYKREGVDNQTFIIWQLFADQEFVKTMEIELNEGRDFSREMGTDSSAIILNERAVSFLGLTEPVGKRLFLQLPGKSTEKPYNIIGVMKNFHFQTLKKEIRPMAVRLLEWNPTYLLCRINSNNLPETLSFLKDKWNNFTSDQPIEFEFLDEKLEKQYNAEQLTGKLFSLFSILTLLIACLGLFGLSAYMAEQRTKEIGIRKVLGASIPGILYLYSKEFLLCVLISNVIAWPAAWIVMNNWLRNFVYRTGMGWDIFVISGFTAVIITIITISYHSVKAFSANPVNSLRYE